MTPSICQSTVGALKNNPSEFGNAKEELCKNNEWNHLQNLKLQFLRMENNLDSVSRKLVLLESFIEHKFQQDFVNYSNNFQEAESSSSSDEDDTLCESEVSQSSVLPAPEEQEKRSVLSTPEESQKRSVLSTPEELEEVSLLLAPEELEEVSLLLAPEELEELSLLSAQEERELGETYIGPRDEDLSDNSTAMTLLSSTTADSSVLQNATSSSFNSDSANYDNLSQKTLTSPLPMEVEGETYICPRNGDTSVNSTMMTTCLSPTAVSSVRDGNVDAEKSTNASGLDETLCGETQTSLLSTCNKINEETYVGPRNEDSNESLTKMTFLPESNGISDSNDSHMFDSDDDDDKDYLKNSDEAESSCYEDALCESEGSQSSILSAPEEREERSLLSAPEEREVGETYICPRDEDLSVNSTAMTLLSSKTDSSALQNVTSSLFDNASGNYVTLCKETLTSLFSMEVSEGETYVCPRNEEPSVNSTMMTTCLSLTASNVRDESVAAEKSTSNASEIDDTLCEETQTSSLSNGKNGDGDTYVGPRNEDLNESLTKMTFIFESNGSSNSNDSHMFDSDDEEDKENSTPPKRSRTSFEIPLEVGAHYSLPQHERSLGGISLSSCGHQSISHSFDGHVECSLCHQDSLHIKSILEQEQKKKEDQTKEKPFQCSLCEKSFSRKFYLDQHQQTHNPDRPFSCSLCNKSFRRAYNLQEHELTHKEDMHVKCPKCPIKFARKRNLDRHILKKHTEVTATNSTNPCQ